MSPADEYRIKAGDLAAFARAERDPFQRAEYERLSAFYLRLADQAERNSHTDVVYEASFNADGSRVVTAGADGTARVWDVATGAPVAALIGHSEAVYTAAFSPDGTLVATGSQDDTVRVWDSATGKVVHELTGQIAETFLTADRIMFRRDTTD